ncbi:MAG: glycosyltransferase family 4 protein [Parcubacteria group bacterium]|nr:glycosyltransferase family 4 protein [Parcubacteria group bacterium]
MRLLILTQKVDAADDVLGFFYHWLLEFSRHVEFLTVICLERGSHNFPANNIEIISLGKERGNSRLARFFNFYKYIWQYRNKYDSVFVHMNPEYLVLGGLLWRIWRKKIGLWYVHRQVNLKLRVAEKLAHTIFSTTPEAFRLRSKKVLFLGHGINFSQFERRKIPPPSKPFRILHVGRITPIKNLDILIKAAHIIKNEYHRPFEIKLLGGAATKSDEAYKKELEKIISEHGLQGDIKFLGRVPFPHTLTDYHMADISVNLTPTGGMDKSVLESIASGTIALSANKAFRELFGKYTQVLLYNERDPKDAAEKIQNIMNMHPSERKKIEDYVYERARKHFNLDTLIKRIIHELHHL